MFAECSGSEDDGLLSQPRIRREAAADAFFPSDFTRSFADTLDNNQSNRINRAASPSNASILAQDEDLKVEDSTPSPVKELDESRIEGLEQLLLRTQRRLFRVYKKLNSLTEADEKEKNDGNSVCIDFKGSMKRDGEVWAHRDDLNNCVQCKCKVSPLLYYFQIL